MLDYRLTEAKVDNDRVPNYFCARYTTNGYHYVQKCNPDPDRNSGVTRQMMIDLLDFLKKGHWIDKQTRLISISMQVRSNNGGVRYVTRFMFELTQMAAVLPSFDMEAMVDDPDSTAKMKVYMMMALGLTAYFMMLEAIEFVQSGPSEYFSNVWNVLDWANFLLFFQVFAKTAGHMNIFCHRFSVVNLTVGNNNGRVQIIKLQLQVHHAPASEGLNGIKAARKSSAMNVYIGCKARMGGQNVIAKTFNFHRHGFRQRNLFIPNGFKVLAKGVDVSHSDSS